MPSSTAVATAVAYNYGPVDPSPSIPYNMLDLGEVNSMLNGHREFLTRSQGRGTSLERTDHERRAQDRPNRLGALAHISASSNALVTPPFTESPSTMQPGGADASFFPEVTQDSRTRKVDHRVSLGPEKAWSISTGEVAGEDGQVEKSIAEAISGTEPNARASRKASHSLRFFKEGNPDDKAKKKDTRHIQSQREKLPPTAEVPDESKSSRSDDSAAVRALPTAKDQSLEADKPSRPRLVSARASEASDTATSPDERLEGKTPTQAGQPGKPEEARLNHALPGSHSQVAVERESVSDSALEGERGQSVGEGVCEAAEEGEESGEEKISSALFVPHQGPEQSEEEVPSPSAPPRAVPSRTLSRTDDFHPWLVKAGEPEPDDKLERVDYERKPRPEPADIPTIAPEVDFSHVDGSAIADESDAGVRPKLSRPVSQYQEEIVHDHQWTPKQPLEAIELIPYKHQVGGHTTLWRFSRRAVCKQLNNRENEFYEKIEKYHRDLLAFLPRYV
jgi:inositol-hexakisphosphate kinase